MVSQALVQVLGLADVLRCPLSCSVELAENVVARLLFEVGANRVDVVFVGFAGLAGPVAFSRYSCHGGEFGSVGGMVAFPLDFQLRMDEPTDLSQLELHSFGVLWMALFACRTGSFFEGMSKVVSCVCGNRNKKNSHTRRLCNFGGWARSGEKSSTCPVCPMLRGVLWV